MHYLPHHQCGLLEMQGWELCRSIFFSSFFLFIYFVGVNVYFQHREPATVLSSLCVQRLAEDRNPAIAAAASRTIQELKRQWEIEDGDSWRFMVNQIPMEEKDKFSKEEDDD